jgi:outer membrane protein OmpA-like peptidoglycan-associated protein
LYEYNSAALTQGSKKVIDDNLLKMMNDKPAIRIQIMSHTDSRGNDDYNMELSQQRAQSVVDYLIGKGISRGRLEARGYGETRLANKCSNGVSCTGTQHQANRRTEFRIL